MAKQDKLTLAAKAAAIWFIKVSDYGEESVDYLNGQSSIFAGDGWSHAEKIKRDLKAALTGKGISARDLVTDANMPPHTKKRPHG